jgi:hypothetical protein
MDTKKLKGKHTSTLIQEIIHALSGKEAYSFENGF